MIAVFPEPPASVADALRCLQILRSGDTTRIQELGLDQERLARPWEPATCEPGLRRAMWEWCDSVVAWLNSDYQWRPAGMIPPCWPQHPHLTHELPVLACLRWAAEDATVAEPLEDWHRITLPAFLERMTQRLDNTKCLTTGVHQDWPGRAKYAAYTTTEAVEQRQALFHPDTTTHS